MGDEGRRVLTWLPLFPGGHAMPEALEVLGRVDAGLGDEAEPLAWLETGLEQLEHAALLAFDQDRRLYRFHQTVLDYVRRHTALTSEQHDAASGALLGFYRQYLVAHWNDYPAIDRCFDNALALMESVWQRHEQGNASPELDQVLAAMMEALGGYFELRGLWKLGHQWEERCITLHRASATERELAHALYRKAILHHRSGEPNAARAAGDQRSLGQPAGADGVVG